MTNCFCAMVIHESFIEMVQDVSSDEDGLELLESGTRLTNEELVALLDSLNFQSKDFPKIIKYKHQDCNEIISFLKDQLDDPAYKNTGQVMRILREVIAQKQGAGEEMTPEEKEQLLKKLGVAPPSQKTLLEKIESKQTVNAEDAVKMVLQGKKNPNTKGKSLELKRGKINNIIKSGKPKK